MYHRVERVFLNAESFGYLKIGKQFYLCHACLRHVFERVIALKMTLEPEERISLSDKKLICKALSDRI